MRSGAGAAPNPPSLRGHDLLPPCPFAAGGDVPQQHDEHVGPPLQKKLAPLQSKWRPRTLSSWAVAQEQKASALFQTEKTFARSPVCRGMLVFFYYVVGVIVFMVRAHPDDRKTGFISPYHVVVDRQHEDWWPNQFRLFADSLYFVSTTLTTVGFGDLHPEGQYERLFMVFYILAGLVVVGAVVGDAVGYVLESAMDGLAEQDYEWLELQAGGGPAQSEGGGGAVHAANGKNAGNGKKVGSPVDEGGARHEGGRANGKNVAGEGGGGGGRMVGDGGDGGGRMVVATASPRPSLGTTQLFTGVEVKNDLSSDEGEEGDHSFLVRRAADVLSRQSSKNSKEGAVSKKRVAGRSVGEREEGVFGKKIRQRKPGAGEHNKSCTPDAPLLSLLKPLYVPKPPPHKKLSRADRKRSLDQHLLLIGAVRKIRLLFFFLFPLLFGAFVVFLFERAPSSSDGGGGNPNPDGGADGAGDGWTFIDGLYWATTVASTVGYGDPAPKNISTRIFSIFYLLLATACLGVVVSRYAQLQVRLLLLKKRIEFNHLEDEEFGDLLAQYDVDGNRRIEKVEFLSACLVGMAKVSAAEVEEILAKFDELDRDRSGAIGIEDMRSRSGLIGPEN